MAHGSQMAQLTTGGMVELMTRSSKNGVGDTADIVILDESQYIREEELAALLPTQITRSDMRTLYVGTPPPDYSDGSVIRAFRKKLYHTDQWLEYSLNNYLELTEKTLDDIELTSPEVLKATNPSYPELVKADNLKTEAVIMHRDTYLREHLGYWADDAPRRLFDKKIWDNLAAPQKVVFDNPAIGVYFSVDGETVSVVVAQKMEGQTYVQAVDTRATRQGLDWLADWILERRQIRVMYFDGIGSESLAQKIKPKYIKKVKLSRVAEVINANSLMLQKFFEGSIRHFDQPGLNQAILSCEKRPIGKAGGFGFQPIYDDIPVYLVPAMALAVYGAEKNDTTQKIVSI
jgi:hypothetical protein